MWDDLEIKSGRPDWDQRRDRCLWIRRKWPQVILLLLKQSLMLPKNCNFFYNGNTKILRFCNNLTNKKNTVAHQKTQNFRHRWKTSTKTFWSNANNFSVICGPFLKVFILCGLLLQCNTSAQAYEFYDIWGNVPLNYALDSPCSKVPEPLHAMYSEKKLFFSSFTSGTSVDHMDKITWMEWGETQAIIIYLGSRVFFYCLQHILDTLHQTTYIL